MAEINYIRCETNKKGRSYAEVARQTGIDSRTVKKYSDMEDFNPKEPIKQKRRSPVMDPSNLLSMNG
ncbi:hypothetical protein JNUCC1_02662 [Lentibacillus sp. JNUCC-1]|nr:hypothetical protein [Lentibacillus sp. JNUCC-1]